MRVASRDPSIRTERSGALSKKKKTQKNPRSDTRGTHFRACVPKFRPGLVCECFYRAPGARRKKFVRGKPISRGFCAAGSSDAATSREAETCFRTGSELAGRK